MCFARVRSLLIIWVLLPWSVLGQCPGDAFLSGDFSGWQKQIGTKGYGIGVQTVVTPYASNDTMRFKVNRGPAQPDLQIGNLLQTIPPGYDYSIRLGDYSNGGKAERMQFTWEVGPTNNIVYYKYAIVSQQPNHGPEWLPIVGFLVRDENDSIIECSEQTIIPGYTSIPLLTAAGSPQIKYTEWRTVAIDLSPYEGQNVKFEAANSDCGLGQHFSYTYFVVGCGSKNQTTRFCSKEIDAIIDGPPGFDSYLWETGETTQNIIYSNAKAGDSITCTASSFTCNTEFIYEIKSSDVEASFSVEFDTVALAAVVSNSSNALNSEIVSNTWAFGDGNASSVKNPVHTYDSFGVFDIKLIVQNEFGCLDSVSKRFVNYPPPYPDFDALDSCGLTVSFQNMTLPPAVGEISGYKWDFGDGSTSADLNPTRRYSEPGTYLVNLTVEASSIIERSVQKYIRVYSEPVAAFQFDSACVDNPVNFSNNSSIENGEIVDWIWAFGDEIKSEEWSPTLSFEQPSMLLVSLEVLSSNGCLHVAETSVEIYPKTVKAIFDLGSEELVLPNTQVEILDQSINPATWTWTLDSNWFSSDSAPSLVVKNDTGTFAIRLLVTNEYSCQSEMVSEFRVVPPFAFFVPSAFSPDGDNLNDHFLVKGEGISKFSLEIRDRWGLKVVTITELNTPIELMEIQAGVLSYEAVIYDLKGQSHYRQGTISVIR